MLRAAPSSWAGEELGFILDPRCGSCTQGFWGKAGLIQSETSVIAVLWHLQVRNTNRTHSIRALARRSPHSTETRSLGSAEPGQMGHLISCREEGERRMDLGQDVTCCCCVS